MRDDAAMDSPGGLILFTGPTGSGKTATMYSCIQKLNNGKKKKINTIEDPDPSTRWMACGSRR